MNKFNQTFNVDFNEKYAEPLKKKGAYLEYVDGNLKIKDEYLYVQNDILLAFMK